jgi:PAP2 superfamily/Vanadium chloroperoxidase N-terminal domain
MKLRLATILALAVALVAATFSSSTSITPSAKAQSAGWDLNAYGPRPSTDNAILYWNETLLEIIRKHPPLTGPTVVARALGILHTATYDAWAAYDPVAKGTRLGSQLRRPEAERTLDNKQKAISFAAYRVLTDLFPNPPHTRMGEVDLPGRMRFRGYDPDDTSTDTATPQGIGNVVAKALLDYRHHDGSNQLGDEPDRTTPDPTKRYADYTGYAQLKQVNRWNSVTDVWRWQSLCVPLPPAGTTTCSTEQRALTPQWGKVTPFALISPSQFRVTGPPKNADGSYSTVDIAQEITDAANLDDVKKAKAEYWADGPFSVFPPGHDFIFAQALSRRRNHSIDHDAKFFFLLGNAMMDASIASWYQKYKYDFVRPITAIRYNPAFKDKMVNTWLGPNQGFNMRPGSEWRPYQALNVVTPPFPEYVSGHSTFSGAGATMLAQFIGTDNFGAYVVVPRGSSAFESNTPSTDVRLSWSSFSASADEAGWSRRYGGIHFRTGDMHGRALGRQVALYVWSTAQNYINGRTAG